MSQCRPRNALSPHILASGSCLFQIGHHRTHFSPRRPFIRTGRGACARDDVVAAGDQVALRLILRGTHQGDFLGLPATGRTIEYVSYEFYRITDGLFAEEWICSDTATLQAQLTAGSDRAPAAG
jgi:hypothetical protein